MVACLDHGVHVVEEYQFVCLDCGTQFCHECGDFLHGAEPCLVDERLRAGNDGYGVRP